MKLFLDRSTFMGKPWRHLARTISLTLTASLLISGLSLFAVSSAQAEPVTATGTNPSICNQEVGNALNVVAYRLSGGDCVIEFKNSGSTTWTVPSGVTSVSLLVVGGGGGGGSRAAGGGGGGGFAETTNYSVTAGNIHAITVGAGGPGAASSSAANGSAGTASSFLRSATGLIANGGAGGLDHLSPGFGKGGASGSASGTGAVSSKAGGSQLGSGNCAGNWCGGGGGGAGAVGATALTTGGGGGNGRASSITGTPNTYAGGGGGGSGSNSNTPTPGGAGGSGGGGAGTTSTQYSCTSQNGTSGTANLGGGGGGAGYCITPNSQGTGGSGGTGVVIISYAMDTTAPTFTSSATFTMAENSVVGINAALFIASETVTITITSGADTAIFNLITASSNSAVIRFKVSPDYEAPSDVGLDNIYDITIRATDTAGNFFDQAITVTVTDVVDTSSFNSLALAGSATTATFRTAVVITATVTVASRVTFRINGKILPGCKNKLASGSSSSFSVTCSWRPSNRGQVTLAAAATPTGAGISSTTSNPVSIMVGQRTGAR